MSEDMMPVMIVTIVFFTIAYIVKIVSDSTIKRKLIEKGMIDENVKFLYHSEGTGSVTASLKWGIVFIAVGTAILIGRFLVPYSYQDEITFSAMFILGGLGLIFYYFIAGKITRGTNDNPE